MPDCRLTSFHGRSGGTRTEKTEPTVGADTDEYVRKANRPSLPRTKSTINANHIHLPPKKPERQSLHIVKNSATEQSLNLSDRIGRQLLTRSLLSGPECWQLGLDYLVCLPFSSRCKLFFNSQPGRRLPDIRAGGRLLSWVMGCYAVWIQVAGLKFKLWTHHGACTSLHPRATRGAFLILCDLVTWRPSLLSLTCLPPTMPWRFQLRPSHVWSPNAILAWTKISRVTSAAIILISVSLVPTMAEPYVLSVTNIILLATTDGTDDNLVAHIPGFWNSVHPFYAALATVRYNPVQLLLGIQ